MNIFLSYPHKDALQAQQLKDILFKGGHVVWMDPALTIGLPWQAQLSDQIAHADAIAIALTPNWLSSPYCQWEFITAVEQGKKIIPVLLSPVSALPHRLSQYQYADFTSGFGDAAKVQKFLDDLVQLAVVIDAKVIQGMDKRVFESQISQQNQGGGHNINVGGSGNQAAGGNMDNRRTSVNLSGGSTIQAGISNIGGDQTFNEAVTVHYSAANAGSGSLQQLEQLMARLNTELAKLPPDQQDDAEAVQSLAQDAVAEAHKPKPNARLLEIKGNGLKQAAQNLLTVAPIAVEIAKTLLMIK